MNVQLENLPNCITTIRAEIPSDRVAKAWDAIAREYAQHAKLPGYRPGKAPRVVVEAKYKKEIKEEVQNRVLSEAVRETIQENKLRVLSVANVEDLEFADDKSLRFTATLVMAPSFELPEYKGLSVEVPSTEVKEEDVDESIERVREQSADFADLADHPLAMDDFAIITYTGTLDGQPVHEAVPAAGKPLSGNSDFWIKLTPDSFLPGFSEQLIGATVGETREFDLPLSAEFPVAALAGKTLHYSVTVNAIKEKVLPPLDDAFAEKIVPGKTLAELRDLARTELGRQKEFEVEQEKRNQALTQLLAKVECELPEGLVRRETERVLTDIVRENQNRGIPDEVIKENQQELLASAAQSARDRLKGTFILLRIAENEKITVAREEFDHRINLMAARYGQPADKLRKELEKADALDKVHEEILTSKVLDFLVSGASVTSSAPDAETKAQTVAQAEASPAAAGQEA